MSIPPNPPPNPPANQPHQPPMSWRNNKRMGAIAATLAVVLIAALFGVVGAVSSGRMDTLASAFVIAPVVSLACVVLGSILTIFESVRHFAVGFLIASAVLIVVTAGGCVAAFQLALGSA